MKEMTDRDLIADFTNDLELADKMVNDEVHLKVLIREVMIRIMEIESKLNVLHN
jgi:hypothetical protein